MTSKLNKSICLLLVTILALSVFSGCSSDGDYGTGSYGSDSKYSGEVDGESANSKKAKRFDADGNTDSDKTSSKKTSTKKTNTDKNTPKSDFSDKGKKTKDIPVNIRPIETYNISYDKYDNGLISLDIPKGWVVRIKEDADYQHFTFMAYMPENPDYMLFVNLKFEGYLKSQAAKDFFNTYDPYAIYGGMPVLDDPTTEGYFTQVYTPTAELNSSGSFAMPYMYKFSVIENFGRTSLGGDLLHATYTNSNGGSVEGIFTSYPVDFGSYMVYENMMMGGGSMVDAGTYSVYDTMFITAPEGEFVNWEKALTHCLESIQFSNAFMQGFNSSLDAEMRSFQAGRSAYNEISDNVMSAWEKRNSSYDIQSQKYSDKTLGYERVYDSDTGEIYKAYNGFLSDYPDSKYKPITDDMYTQSVTGYIEK